MNAAQQQYRSCFAAFIEDIGDLVDRAIRQAIEAELERLLASERRKRSVARAPSRRRTAKPENAGSGTPRRSAKPRGRPQRSPSISDGEAVAERSKAPAAPATPPPLFVHKRSRDGQIQHLSRRSGDDEAAQQTSATG